MLAFLHTLDTLTLSLITDYIKPFPYALHEAQYVCVIVSYSDSFSRKYPGENLYLYMYISQYLFVLSLFTDNSTSEKQPATGEKEEESDDKGDRTIYYQNE